jgi:hypothetical protein
MEIVPRVAVNEVRTGDVAPSVVASEVQAEILREVKAVQQ